MSHVHRCESGKILRSQLHHFRDAVQTLGGVWKENQTTYRTWATDHGSLVGDAPLPEGMTNEDVGTCEHAIGLPNPGHGPENYEIGLVADPSDPNCLVPVYDYWGCAIDRQFSSSPQAHDLGALFQEYNERCYREQAQMNGDLVYEQELPDGSRIVT